MKKVIGLTLALLLLVSFSTSGETANNPLGVDVVKIGVFQPLTGGNSAGGQVEYEGTQAAHLTRPTVLGVPVELVIADSKTDEVEAVTAAGSLVRAGCALAVGGSGSGLCIAGAPTFEAAKVPVLGTGCTNPMVTEGNEYYFRICYTDDFQGVALASYAKNELGAKTAALITDVTDTFTVGLRKYIIEGFGKEGIVADVYFNKGDQDFSAQLATVRAANPDVIFANSQYTEGALLQVQAKQMGYEGPFWLGADGWDNHAYLDIGGDAINGSRLTTFFDYGENPVPIVQKYLDDFDAFLPGELPKSAGTALGYDAYNIALDAIEKCQSLDGPTLRQTLLDNQFQVVTGLIIFDQQGDAIKDEAYIKAVEGGKFIFKEIARLH